MAQCSDGEDVWVFRGTDVDPRGVLRFGKSSAFAVTWLVALVNVAPAYPLLHILYQKNPLARNVDRRGVYRPVANAQSVIFLRDSPQSERWRSALRTKKPDSAREMALQDHMMLKLAKASIQQNDQPIECYGTDETG